MARYIPFKMTREDYIPKDADEIKDERTGVAVYLYEVKRGEQRVPAAMGFGGKRSKPDFNFTYSTQERRAQAVNTYFQMQRDAAERKANRQRDRREWTHGYQVGDILSGSWGYDQTNVEFAEVVEVMGKAIVIRNIAQRLADEGDLSRVLPIPGHYVGEPAVKVPRWPYGEGKGSVRLNESCTLSEWNGKAKYQTPFGSGH